ncbi:MAG: septum formation initiator family protein [Turicibacter sp.]|nr:septum formation initiator family protein [Turicibacter sp.]
MSNFRVIRNRKSHRRKTALRRFVTVSIILGIFVFLGTTMYRNRLVDLNEAEEQLAHYEALLLDARLRQGYYLNEIVRLGDEDYVLMLARQHMMALPDETIFMIEDLGRNPISVDETIDED